MQQFILTMDTLAHLLWTLLFFYRYKHLSYALLIGILPDLLSWGIYMVYTIIKRAHFGKPELSLIPKWVFSLYGVTHSIIIFAIVFAIVWIILGKIPFLLLPWIIHIIIDIPTHTREFLGTPFLWPLSNWLFPGISWGTLWFMLVNYFIITILLLLSFLNKKNLFINFK